MAVVNGVKKELPIIGFKRSRSSQIHRTTLASVESLTMPLVSILFLSLSCLMLVLFWFMLLYHDILYE